LGWWEIMAQRDPVFGVGAATWKCRRLLDSHLDGPFHWGAALAGSRAAKDHRNFGLVPVSAKVATHRLTLWRDFLLIDVASGGNHLGGALWEFRVRSVSLQRTEARK
jgi:hypothetical protein